jgi:RNA polymerase sigma-70 factor (ECF subfamily)
VFVVSTLSMAIHSLNGEDDGRLLETSRIARALDGDGLAYRELVEPHLPVLHRIAYRACGNAALAEDAVQETLALAFDRLASYRPERSFRAYLAAIAAKQAHTLARSEWRRDKRELASAEPQRAARPDEQVQGKQAAQRVREALARMPKKRREAAMLRLDAGLSYREIGEALDSSEGSARVLVHLALKELKSHLADLLGDPSSEETGR